MFGHGNGFIGWGDAAGHKLFCLQNLPDTYETTGVATLAYFLFQFAFADTCSTITSGAMSSPHRILGRSHGVTALA